MNKNILSSIFISTLCFLYSFSILGDNIEQRNRVFTLSTGYLERIFNSNEALVEFPLSVIDGYGALFDSATQSINKNWWSRSLITLIEIPVSYWLANSLFVPFHEFGHAQFFYATGRNYTYTTKGYGKELRGIPNYWVLSLGRFITPPFFFPGSGEASASTQDEPTSVNEELKNYWGNNGRSTVTTARGLNNQTFLAKNIAQEIYQRNGHITQTLHYLGNKISTWVYCFMDRISSYIDEDIRSDPQKILENYQAKGYSILPFDLELQSLLSIISGTTYSLLRGYYNYIAHGDAKVYPAELFGVRIPDINSYINARGISLEFVSGYRFNKNLNLGLAYEFIWKGDSAHQVTPSLNFDIAAIAPAVNSLWIKSNMVIGKGIGGGMEAEWWPYSLETNTSFWQSLSYFGNLTLYNGFNLYGERNITSLKDGKTMSLSGVTGLRINY